MRTVKNLAGLLQIAICEPSFTEPLDILHYLTAYAVLDNLEEYTPQQVMEIGKVQYNEWQEEAKQLNIIRGLADKED